VNFFSPGNSSLESLSIALVKLFPALGDKTRPNNLPEIWFQKHLEGMQHSTGFFYDRLQTIRRKRNVELSLLNKTKVRNDFWIPIESGAWLVFKY